jgi:hypothetical protein
MQVHDCAKSTINNVPWYRNLVDRPRVDLSIATPTIGKQMYKLFTACAAAAVTTLLVLPGPAKAVERGGDGIRNSDLIEVSSPRRHRRYGYSRSYYTQPYYERSYYDRPYYDHGYARGPSWGPAPFPFVFGLPY